MSYSIGYHPDVKARDIPSLPGNLRERVRLAIETRLTIFPEKYGAPLRNTLRGYWKLRVGDFRVVFSIKGERIVIHGIMHRKHVYKYIYPRLKVNEN